MYAQQLNEGVNEPDSRLSGFFPITGQDHIAGRSENHVLHRAHVPPPSWVCSSISTLVLLWKIGRKSVSIKPLDGKRGLSGTADSGLTAGRGGAGNQSSGTRRAVNVALITVIGVLTG